MARSNFRGNTTRRAPKDLGRRVKKKPCALCRDGIEWVDYKDVPLLRKFMSDRGKIRSRRVTGNCAQHQRDIAEAIKTARELVLLPYTQRTVTERPGARRGERGDRGDRPDRGDRGDRPDRGERGDRPERGAGAAASAGDAGSAGGPGAGQDHAGEPAGPDAGELDGAAEGTGAQAPTVTDEAGAVSGGEER
jgi:small subunit ribosomal protein S18